MDLSRSTLSAGDGHSGPIPSVSGSHLRALRPQPIVLVVGYPAPQAVEVVERLLATDGGMIACVVTREQWAEAIRHVSAAGGTDRVRLFEGSASQPGLGLHRRAWRLLDTVGQIWGVASPQEIASGHLQDFADECPRLRELHVVPTLAADGAPGPGSVWATVRRRAWTRPVAVAVALAGAAVALLARTDRSLFDADAGLSWEDVERDLWPGLGPTG
ncbi:hypothetical protein [Rubrivirga sp. IMCC43871]|uniref:hypothetical protein n=1 Tax=Rubrivirga sp. IMCC43871 TaxID=3391575 RepID=UPI00398FDA72